MPIPTRFLGFERRAMRRCGRFMELEWYSEADLKHQARRDRRTRLLRGVRGWLYETCAPRCRTAGLLAASLFVGGIVALGLFLSGLHSIPWICFIGVLGSWPMF